jgi:hypothetical protein
VLDEIDRLIYAPNKYVSQEERNRREITEFPTRNIINTILKSKAMIVKNNDDRVSSSRTTEQQANTEKKFKIEPFQVIGASATIGRPLSRELFQLFNIEQLSDVKNDQQRKYGGAFPIIRPKQAPSPSTFQSSFTQAYDHDEGGTVDIDEESHETENGNEGNKFDRKGSKKQSSSSALHTKEMELLKAVIPGNDHQNVEISDDMLQELLEDGEAVKQLQKKKKKRKKDISSEVEDNNKDEIKDEEEEEVEEKLTSKKSSSATPQTSQRPVTIPQNIDHYILLIPEEIEENRYLMKEEQQRKKLERIPFYRRPPVRRLTQRQRQQEEKDRDFFSLSTRLAFLHRNFFNNPDYLGTWRKAILFVPKLEDILQTLFILKRFKLPGVKCLESLLPRVLSNPVHSHKNIDPIHLQQFFTYNASSAAISPLWERELIILPFSGTRGLHIPNIDTVFILRPPKNLDEYLHLAGRTGRLDCNINWFHEEQEQQRQQLHQKQEGNHRQKSQTPPKIPNKVVTMATSKNVPKMQTWQNLLDFHFQYVAPYEDEQEGF